MHSFCRAAPPCRTVLLLRQTSERSIRHASHDNNDWGDLPCPHLRLTRRASSPVVGSLSCTSRRAQRELIWAWDWTRTGAMGIPNVSLGTPSHSIDCMWLYLQQLFSGGSLCQVLDETFGHKVVKVVAPLVLLLQLGCRCARDLKQDAHGVHVSIGRLDLCHLNRRDAEGPNVSLFVWSARWDQSTLSTMYLHDHHSHSLRSLQGPVFAELIRCKNMYNTIVLPSNKVCPQKCCAWKMSMSRSQRHQSQLYCNVSTWLEDKNRWFLYLIWPGHSQWVEYCRP